MQANNNHVQYDSHLINTMKFPFNQMVREDHSNINFYLAKWDNNYYVNTKGKQVLSIAIGKMNKTVGVSMLVQYELGFINNKYCKHINYKLLLN